MAKVVRVGVSPTAPGKLRKISRSSKVASIAEMREVFFARSHTGECSRKRNCGSHCYLSASRLKIATIRQYRSVAKTWGDLLDAMGEVCEDHVEALRNTVVAKGKRRSTANFVLHVLRTMAHRVWDKKGSARFHRLYVALKSVKPYPQSRHRPRNPPPDVLARIYKMLTPLEQHWAVLMARTGLRKSEMLALTPENYVAHMRELWVVAGSREDLENRKLYEDQLTKTLTDDSCRRLEWLIANQAQNARRRGRARAGPQPGFLFPFGKNYPDALMAKIREFLKGDADRYFPSGTAWHAFRHYSVYQVVEQMQGRADAVVIVKEHLGHKHSDSAMAYLGAARGMSRTPEVHVDIGEENEQ